MYNISKSLTIHYNCRGICSNNEANPVRQFLEPMLKDLAICYLTIIKKQVGQRKEFFGLRDFYRYVTECSHMYVSRSVCEQVQILSSCFFVSIFYSRLMHKLMKNAKNINLPFPLNNLAIPTINDILPDVHVPQDAINTN